MKIKLPKISMNTLSLGLLILSALTSVATGIVDDKKQEEEIRKYCDGRYVRLETDDDDEDEDED